MDGLIGYWSQAKKLLFLWWIQAKNAWQLHPGKLQIGMCYQICSEYDRFQVHSMVFAYTRSSRFGFPCKKYNYTYLKSTGKSLSEAHILASTNPQYDKRLFIKLQVQYMKIASSEHVAYINCSECQNKKQFVYTTCSELGIFMYWTGDSMNNLLSYCGLVDANIRASNNYY